jgi:hypothetical protein
MQEDIKAKRVSRSFTPVQQGDMILLTGAGKQFVQTYALPPGGLSLILPFDSSPLLSPQSGGAALLTVDSPNFGLLRM